MEVISYNTNSFAQALTNKYTPQEVVESKTHFLYLKEYLGSHGLSAKTMVIEDEYVSRDFLHDYSSYYSYCFEQYPKFCKRINFFSNSFIKAEFEDALITKSFSEIWDSYLGFIVVKPIPVTVIGITLLKTYSNNKKFDDRNFWGIREYEIHLFGKALKIESLAFQEQDSVLAACATAAIWSMLNKASKDHYTILKSPSEITKDADSIAFDGSRLFPNHQGLDILQISKAIYNSGLVCEIKQPDSDIKDGNGNIVLRVISNNYLKEIINAYSPVGIPILLVINVPNGQDQYGLHAITISGYNKKAPSFIEPKDEISYLAENITKFYAHDDQWGPFERVSFEKGIELNTPWTNFDDDKRPTYATNVVVPLYPKIRISYENIKVIVMGIDAVLTKFFGNSLKADLVWDIKIRYSEDFKNIIKDSEGLSREKKIKYLCRNCPKYLWIASCYVGDVQIFDFTFDATDVKNGMIGQHVLSYLIDGMNKELAEFLTTNRSLLENSFRHKASATYYQYIIDNISPVAEA